MMEDIKLINSNIGRFFSVASLNTLSEWIGAIEDQNSSDFYKSSLELDFDSFKLNRYSNSAGNEFFTLMSFSQRIEILKIIDDIIIIDGFYFNKKFENLQSMSLNILENDKTEITIEATESNLSIFDSTYNGSQILEAIKTSQTNSNTNFYTNINFNGNKINVHNLKINIEIDNRIYNFDAIGLFPERFITPTSSSS